MTMLFLFKKNISYNEVVSLYRKINRNIFYQLMLLYSILTVRVFMMRSFLP